MAPGLQGEWLNHYATEASKHKLTKALISDYRLRFHLVSVQTVLNLV